MDDIEKLENNFRAWLETADALGPSALMTDSNTFVTEITHAVDNWELSHTPLPSIFHVLAYIFSRIPSPPQAFLFPEYFRDVLYAHDAGDDIPEIPTHIYRTALATTAPTHAVRSTTEKGKRKRVQPPRSDAEATNTTKKRRMAEPLVKESVVEYSQSSADEGEEDGDFEDDQDYYEEPKPPKPRGLRLLVPSPQPPTSRNDPVQPRPHTVTYASNPTTLPSTEIKSTRKQPKRRSQIKSAELVPDDSGDEAAAALPSAAPPPPSVVPPITQASTSLTEAQRREFWKQDGIHCDTKGKEPILLSEPCEKCKADGRRCWGLEGMKACLYCRVLKKVACSLAQEGPKTQASKAATVKGMKETEKGRAMIATEQLKKGNEADAKDKPKKGKDKAATEGSSTTPAPARASRGRSRSRAPSVSAPSIDMDTAAQNATPVSYQADKGSSGVAKVAGVSDAGRVMDVAASQPVRVLPQASIVTDPLTCAPATLNEVRYPAPFTMSRSVVQPVASRMGPPSLPAADAAARIEALENEVRRLAARVQEENQIARREMSEMSSRTWQLWEKVWTYNSKIVDHENRIRGLEQYSPSAMSDIRSWNQFTVDTNMDLFTPTPGPPTANNPPACPTPQPTPPSHHVPLPHAPVEPPDRIASESCLNQGAVVTGTTQPQQSGPLPADPAPLVGDVQVRTGDACEAGRM